MKTTAFYCDRCKEPVNGKGYSVSIDEGFSPVGMDILCGIDPAYDRHYCGRQCLMIVINERVDRLEKVEDGPTVGQTEPSTSPGRELRPYTERRAVKMVPAGVGRDLGTATPSGSLEGTERSAA